METASLPAGLIDAVQSQSAVLFLGPATTFGAAHPNHLKVPDAEALRDALSDHFLGGELKDKPLSAVAEYASSAANLAKVQEFVHDLLVNFSPADFHLLIPKFRWHGIATTNYDLVVEKAYDPAHGPLQQLVPFVKNGQQVETKLKKAVDGVQFLKLHGSIDHYIDTEIPLILATEQYGRYSKHRSRLFERFRDWGMEFPILFCGYSVSDPHIQTILFDLFDLERGRPMYYVVDPEISPFEERYWSAHRITPIKQSFGLFLKQLDREVSSASRALRISIGGGTSSLRSHYKVANAAETKSLLIFLSDDVEHVRKGMPIEEADAKDFYRGLDRGWGAIEQNLDVTRSITDSLVVDAILASEDERPAKVDLYAIKGPAGNGKTVVLKRAAWMAAHDYGKIVLFLKPGGAFRDEVVDEIFRYVKERIFVFVDRAALYAEEIQRLIEFGKSRGLLLTLVVAERDAEWNVRCDALDKYGFRDYPVRYLSERAVRELLEKLDEHDSLGLLKELSNFEDRVQRLMGGAQRQLLVALHEATLGRAFEDIVFEEYQRIIPREAQTIYLDICTLHRLGVSVRAGLISRVSGIDFVEFGKRFFKPLQHIVNTRADKYIGDNVYTARHQHVAEMVFDRVLVDVERRYDQIIRIMSAMNLDYTSDRSAFGQLVRGRWVSESLRSRELGRAFFDAAEKVAPNEGFLLQQRAIFEMEEGGDLSQADKYLNRAQSLEPYNRSIQHSLAVLARKQALETANPLLRQRLRDRAKTRISSLIGGVTDNPYGYHTAAQIALDDLKDIFDGSEEDKLDPMVERRIVELSRDFENYVQEGLQKFPLSEHLLAVESDYWRLVAKFRAAEAALTKAFEANPRQDWIAIRLARALRNTARYEEAKKVLIRSLQENPTSKRTHYALALLYINDLRDVDEELILDHLRRSFTRGDQNYEAQFWYGRQVFLRRNYQEAKEVFQSLRSAAVSPKEINAVRGTVLDGSGHTRFFVGEVVTREEGYLFVRCVDFPESIFVHRTKVAEEQWPKLTRGSKVTFTVGFTFRGAAGASVRFLN